MTLEELYKQFKNEELGRYFSCCTFSDFKAVYEFLKDKVVKESHEENHHK